MPIFGNRRNTQDLMSNGLHDVLLRNGMTASITQDADGHYKMTVQSITPGGRSPEITYNLSAQQVERMMNWGNNSQNNAAYRTFTDIVKNDFLIKSNSKFYTGASYAGGSTVRMMGRHFGYKDEYKVSPGALSTDGWGFYFKGQQNNQQQTRRRDSGLPEVYITSIINLDKTTVKGVVFPKEPPVPYSKEITSDAYFTNEKWQKVLLSHGIGVGDSTNRATGQNEKMLVIKSSDLRKAVGYKLTDEQYKKLTAEHVDGKNGVPLQERLDIINTVIGQDFNTKLTKEMLDSNERVSLNATPAARQQIEAPLLAAERRQAEQQRMQRENDRIRQDLNAVNGRDISTIMGARGFFQPLDHGREIVVGEIRVDNAAGARMVKAESQLTGADFLVAMKRTGIYIDPSTNTVTIEGENGKTQKSVFVNIDDYTMRMLTADSFKGTGPSAEERMETIRAAIERQQPELLKNNVWQTQWLPLAKDNFNEIMDGKLTMTDIPKGYVMSAVINGQLVQKDISQKEYDKFRGLDDKHRLMLFDQLFKEVSIKDRNGRHGDDLYKAGDLAADIRQEQNIAHATTNEVDGETLKEINARKGFYTEYKGGRQVEVGNVAVAEKETGKYEMTAFIDGQAVSHEISKKEFEKFMAMDDYHRLKMFAKVFPEVAVKTNPEDRVNFGAALLAGMTAVTQAVQEGLFRQPAEPRPSVYVTETHAHAVFTKPGVTDVPPMDPAMMAAMHADAQLSNIPTEQSQDIHRGV